MAARPYWKDYLKLSLVACPVALYPASTEAEKAHFHQINTRTGHRLRQQMVDEATDKALDGDHKGRGYALSKGRYVPITEEDLQAVQIESRHTTEFDSFVPKDEIDERFIEKPYDIVPNGDAGEESGNVINLMEALRQSVGRRSAAKKNKPAGRGRRARHPRKAA